MFKKKNKNKKYIYIDIYIYTYIHAYIYIHTYTYIQKLDINKLELNRIYRKEHASKLRKLRK